MPDNIQATGLEFDTRDFERAIQRAERRLDDLEDSVDRSGKAAKRAETNFLSAAKGVAGFLGVYQGMRILKSGARDIFDTNVEFQQLEARLVSITGSTAAATDAFDLITKFAASTPFEIQNLTEAFTQLSAVGIRPTAGHLEDLGNFAAAMGRNITDFASAVIRAGAGETEALKSFGVVARSEGDKLKVTFRGVTREVEKDFEPVVEMFREIARENFADGMARQMGTLGGALSNVADSASIVAREMGEDTGMNGEMVDTIRLVDQLIQSSEGLARSFGSEFAGGIGSVNDGLQWLIDHKGAVTGALQGIGIALDMYLPSGGFFNRLATPDPPKNTTTRDLFGVELGLDEPPAPKSGKGGGGGSGAVSQRATALKAMAEAERRAQQSIESTIDALLDQNTLLTAGEEAMLLWSLTAKGANQEQIDLALETFRANRALEEQQKLKQIVFDFNNRVITEEDRAAAGAHDAALQRMAELEAEYEQMKATADRMAESVTDSFVDIITGTESVADAFGNMVDEIIRELTRLAVRRSIMEPFLDLLGAALGQSYGMPSSGTALRNGSGLEAVPKSSALASPGMRFGGGQGLVVNQNFNMPVQALDGPSVVETLRAHRGEILSMVADGVQESSTFRQMLNQA